VLLPNGDNLIRFNALMQIAQEQQGYFITKQAIESGYADKYAFLSCPHRQWERISARPFTGLAQSVAAGRWDWTPAFFLWDARDRDEQPVGASFQYETGI